MSALGYLGGSRITSMASVAEGHLRLISWLFAPPEDRSVAARVGNEIVQDEGRS
jgi:hypothetical protein